MSLTAEVKKKKAAGDIIGYMRKLCESCEVQDLYLDHDSSQDFPHRPRTETHNKKCVICSNCLLQIIYFKVKLHGYKHDDRGLNYLQNLYNVV